MKNFSRSTQSKTGFTIIEVALVIAIGGLIFLMVFIALPGLRAQQRDTERRENIMSLLDTIKKYQTNNRGALPGSSEISNNAIPPVTWEAANSPSNAPTTWAGFYRDYLGETFMDPGGRNYTLNIYKCDGVSNADEPCNIDAITDARNAMFPNGYNLYVVLQATCNGDEAVSTKNPRKLAVLYKLEGSGMYCNNT